MTTNKKTELPKFPKDLFKAICEKIRDKRVDLGDELRENLALDSIAKAEIIRGLRQFESYILECLKEIEEKHEKWRGEMKQQLNDLFDDLFAELEDQKYDKSYGHDLLVIDFADVIKPLLQFKQMVLGALEP
jgi:hypothetical protein